MLRRIIIIVVVVGLIVLALLWSQQRTEPLKVSGFIEADEIRVGSRVGGRVRNVHVNEGQIVEAGASLVELEPFDLLERRADVEARLAQARANFEKLSNGFRPEEIEQARARHEQLVANLQKLVAGPRAEDIEAARARVSLAESRETLAKEELERTRSAAERGGARPIEVQRALSTFQVQEQELAVANEELAKLLAGTREEDISQARAQVEEAAQQLKLKEAGYRPEEIDGARAAMDAAAAELDVIDRQIEELVVRAPTVATVEAIDLQPGDLVAPDAPMLALIDHRRLWVRAYVPENRLNLEIGQRVAVTVNSFADETFAATLSFISRQAEFTPGNVQTPEERSKQVFRIKATLVEGADRLRPGMVADVWLEGALVDGAGD
ncbi:MAG: HlyD family secretion protein [Planctomycetota bacterium]|jgi:multidrug resistance efflux pump